MSSVPFSCTPRGAFSRPAITTWPAEQRCSERGRSRLREACAAVLLCLLCMRKRLQLLRTPGCGLQRHVGAQRGGERHVARHAVEQRERVRAAEERNERESVRRARPRERHARRWCPHTRRPSPACAPRGRTRRCREPGEPHSRDLLLTHGPPKHVLLQQHRSRAATGRPRITRVLAALPGTPASPSLRLWDCVGGVARGARGGTGRRYAVHQTASRWARRCFIPTPTASRGCRAVCWLRRRAVA